MKKRMMTFTAAALAATMMLAGCGASSGTSAQTEAATQAAESSEADADTQGEAGEGAQGNASGETVTITDDRGEVEIPADPQRIVDISGNSDMLSILGYSVVGTANSDAYDYTVFPAYLEDVLEGAKILGYSMQPEVDIEAVLELDPDLIIISSVQEGMYEQLQKVAPTVLIELAQIDWTEDLRKVAAIFDKSEEAESWLADYYAQAQAMGDQIKEEYGEDTTYLAFLASGESLYIFDAAGVGSVMFDDMGLAKSEGMPEQTDISLPVVTYEGLAAIDADYIIAVGTDADLEALNASAIWQNMRAVQDGHVVQLPASPYFNMGYSSIGKLKFVQEFADMLGTISE